MQCIASHGCGHRTHQDLATPRLKLLQFPKLQVSLFTRDQAPLSSRMLGLTIHLHNKGPACSFKAEQSLEAGIGQLKTWQHQDYYYVYICAYTLRE